jgi:acetamidase/formamidase
MGRTRYFPVDKAHFTWDVRHEPMIAIDSGDVVVVRTRDVSDNQITPASTASTLATLDWERVYPLSGPIYMKGAQPGDALAINPRHAHRGVGMGCDPYGVRAAGRRLQNALSADLRPHQWRRRLPAR